MVSYEHKNLLDSLANAEQHPPDDSELSLWLHGGSHVHFLLDDLNQSELTLAALSPTQTLINSFVVPSDLPELREGPLRLADWSPNPHHFDASTYAWAWSTGNVYPLHRNDEEQRASDDLPPAVSPLVFFRSIEGDDVVSREVAQDFTHSAGIHWRRERSAFSRINFRGDWEDVVSQSTLEQSAPADLFSVRREVLDLHLAALDAVLVRVFGFILRRPSLPTLFNFSAHVERQVTVDAEFQYREMVNAGNFGVIRGAQIIRPQLSARDIDQLVKKGRIVDPSEVEPVEFIVQDIRSGGTATVSTDPSTTTNYFEMKVNSLPVDTSPAFFRPEVLGKYKASVEKYDVFEGHIKCRGGWWLKNYSANAAGQIAVYICDLRNIPQEEQIHWKTYNEAPKAGLSARAIQTDFEGKLPQVTTPRERLLEVFHRWQADEPSWWKWRLSVSPFNLTVPRMEDRKEWSDAVMWLSSGVVEGFVVKDIRRVLRDESVEVDKEWRSIKLLEQALPARGVPLPAGQLEALREVNECRISSGAVHAIGREADEFIRGLLEEHNSYRAHFESLCDRVVKELILVEGALTEHWADRNAERQQCPHRSRCSNASGC